MSTSAFTSLRDWTLLLAHQIEGTCRLGVSRALPFRLIQELSFAKASTEIQRMKSKLSALILVTPVLWYPVFDLVYASRICMSNLMTIVTLQKTWLLSRSNISLNEIVQLLNHCGTSSIQIFASKRHCKDIEPCVGGPQARRDASPASVHLNGQEQAIPVKYALLLAGSLHSCISTKLINTVCDQIYHHHTWLPSHVMS